MTLNAEKVETKVYCHQLAIQLGLDPIGYAGDFDDAIIVEVPLPWKRNMMQQENFLPDEMKSLLELWLQQYYDGQGYPHRSLIVAPDERYHQDGYRRVMFYTRPEGLSAQYTKTEYLVPEAKLGQLIWSLYETPRLLPDFEQFRVIDGDKIRDLLVCTHGAVDAACGRFGYPLYKTLRDEYASDAVRVWRVSHFGGHVFAPTVMDMPLGHYWAYIQTEQIDPLVNHSGDATVMRGHFRGSALIGNSFLQVADGELWQRHGWAWFTYHKVGKIIDQDTASETPQWAEVEICYKQPDNPKESRVHVRVEVSHVIETHPSTGQDHTHEYPQYVVSQLEEII